MGFAKPPPSPAVTREASGRKVTFTRDERMHDIAIVPLEPTGFAIVSKHHYDWMLANGYGERWTAEVPFDDFVPMVCAPSADGRAVSVSKALDVQGWACAVVKV